MELIASFWHEGKEYSLVRHIDPTLLLAVEAEHAEKGLVKWRLVSEEESKIMPVIELLMTQKFA